MRARELHRRPRRASIRSPRTSTCDTALPAHTMRATAPVLTSLPRPASHRAAGVAYNASSGTRGSPIAASRRDPPNICASTRTNGAAAATSICWFSAATASGSQSSSQSRAVCRCRRSHARDRLLLLLRIDWLTAAVPPRRARECWSNREGSRAIAPGERRPAQQTADQVQRRRQVHRPQA